MDEEAGNIDRTVNEEDSLNREKTHLFFLYPFYLYCNSLLDFHNLLPATCISLQLSDNDDVRTAARINNLYYFRRLHNYYHYDVVETSQLYKMTNDSKPLFSRRMSQNILDSEL